MIDPLGSIPSISFKVVLDLYIIWLCLVEVFECLAQCRRWRRITASNFGLIVNRKEKLLKNSQKHLYQINHFHQRPLHIWASKKNPC